MRIHLSEPHSGEKVEASFATQQTPDETRSELERRNQELGHVGAKSKSRKSLLGRLLVGNAPWIDPSLKASATEVLVAISNMSSARLRPRSEHRLRASYRPSHPVRLFAAGSLRPP